MSGSSASMHGALSAGERLYRARRIGLTFGRIYLNIKGHQLIARTLAPRDMKKRWSRLHRRSASEIFDTAVELRGMILKGCQFLGSRADVLPPEYVAILAELQDQVPPQPFEVIRGLVEDELGAPLSQHFRDFEPFPVASASLAQVHRAELHTGERVAVKVQYPDIGPLVRSDLANLRALFTAVGIIERDLDLMPLIEELGDHVPRELDFRREGQSAETIAGYFEARDDVHVPRIHWPLSTERVLVMEYIEGIKITDEASLARAGVDSDALMKTLIEVYCEQILRHGHFHADPHPGNLMVEPGAEPGAPARLVLLDFGLTKELPGHFRDRCLEFAMALLRGAPDAMARALVQLGFETREAPEQALRDISSVVLDVAKSLRHGAYVDPSVMRGAGEALPRMIRENPIVRVPTHVVLLARVFALLSGLGRSLSARVDMVGTILPFAMPTPPSGTESSGS